MSRALRFVPLVVILLFASIAIFRLLNPSDDRHPSQLIGKPVPQFTLTPALPNRPGLSSADLTGSGPRLVNIFASWCVPCAAEAPMLEMLAGQGVKIDAIAIRDRPEDIAAFLARYGDPFDRIGSDPQSQVQLALGSSGVPESFIVDSKGIIRYQHIGPITSGDIPMILKEMEAAR